MKTNTPALCAFFVLFALPIFSQVGINNTSPKSLLDITPSSTETPLNTDGIIIPRISNFPTVNPGVDQNGMMVFLTVPIGIQNKGFYYWDAPNNRWVPIGAEEWTAGTNNGGDNLIYATRAKLSGTDMVITDDGRIGFGTSDPIERFEFKGPGDNDFQITSANTNPPNYILYNTGGTLENPTALAANGEIGALIVKTHDGNNIVETGGFRFYMDGVATPGSAPSKFIISTTPVGSTMFQERLTVRSTGNMGINVSNPTANLHIKGGTAAAGSAPLKLTSGTNLSTPEAGAVEFNGSSLFFTPATMRQTIMKGYVTTATLDFPNITQNSSADLTVSVPGAAVGDNCYCSPSGAIELGISWNCFVSPANTVIIRVANVRAVDIDPASRSWKVNVIK
ncbi:hypothetical protein QRD02_04940 [Aequorivita sp. SDUM287046]|uniref:Uncharacterized protein n=1 Tax=Aequorivita aurantiaca TaxID=3053356 RepID=A0ABT8DFP7_9FLAO|nr:hypothetical protein [Aequorivita aurantiaca]MDN3723718.1 hypothetical protein [Aequorivita aurantiaca]